MKPKSPPQASTKDFSHFKHEDQRHDPYFWLKNKESEEVMKYLDEENEYAGFHLKKFQPLSEKLFKEMRERIPLDYDTAPVKWADYLYYESWRSDKEYPIYKRLKQENKSKEEILLDVNLFQKTHKYIDVDDIWPSSDQNLLAYAIDTEGREFYNIYFKDLKKDQLLPACISEVTSDFVWAHDNRTVFYVKQDKETLRPYQVFRFDIYTEEHTLVFEEKDARFSVSVNKPFSEEYIFILSYSTQTTEWWFVQTQDLKKDFSLIKKRQKDHKYFVDQGEESFYILTNSEDAFNYRLVKSSISHPDKWQEVIPHNKNILIEDINVFKDFITLEVRADARTDVWLFDKNTKQVDKIRFSDSIYSCHLGDMLEYETQKIRLDFSSPVSPPKVYDYDYKTKKTQLIKEMPIGGGFSSKNYTCERHNVKARDGTLVPVTLTYRSDNKLSEQTPCLLYGYGAYGISMDASFSSSIFSLIDRGFIYAVAHVRGGCELGKNWYYQGRLLKKKNTFTDFIDVAQYLQNKKLTSSSRLCIEGASAGGLLIGAVLNEAPSLFHAAIAKVPFVDVLTTMLDDKIPLSVGEYEEWGNPNEKTFYDYIKSYSPYDNVKKTSYPHLFIRTGLHDPRVQYFEPAKWCARLRAFKTDQHQLLLITDKESGHFGPTGRFSRIKKQALEQAFFINSLNL